MAYTRPPSRKKCTLVLLDEMNRPIIDTAKKMFGINEANYHGQIHLENYNNKRSETEPKAEKWQVIV